MGGSISLEKGKFSRLFKLEHFQKMFEFSIKHLYFLKFSKEILRFSENPFKFYLILL